MKSRLVFEDGTVVAGDHFGAEGTRVGEVVFNTAMAGYQEVLTDPSYAGQIVLMTYPLIGNYGINPRHAESDRTRVCGFVVREWCPEPSHWGLSAVMDTYLRKERVIGLAGIDTRALTRKLRQHGTMRAALTTEDRPVDELVLLARAWNDRGLVPQVTAESSYELEPESGHVKAHVAVLDFGVKKNILRSLTDLGCRVTVFPADSTADEILACRPDGLLISNGPGDPADLSPQLPEIRKLAELLPSFGICLGHQVLGMAFGARTFKMKFGHHGVNHPVKDLRSGRAAITSQNHGYALDPESLRESDLEVTHVNLNDRTIEGIRHRRLPVFSVQYHPEACPGPRDSHPLFREFIEVLGIAPRCKEV